MRQITVEEKTWLACSRIAPRDVTALALTVAAIAAAPGLAGGRAEAAAGIPFLPHQALYDLSLVKSRGSNAINSARGTHSL